MNEVSPRGPLLPGENRFTKSRRWWVAGVLVFWLICGSVAEAQGTAAPQYIKTNLVSFIAGWDGNKRQSNLIYELNPEWVGTVKRVYLRGGEGIYKEDEPNHIRFSHLAPDQFEGLTNFVIFRGGGEGSPINEMPAYARQLPSNKTISEAKNLDELRKLFVPQLSVTDLSGSEDRMHWTQGWTQFTLVEAARLRYLSVFAHVSAAKGQQSVDIDIIEIREGFFRPADPKSEAERKQFKTGAEVWAEYEAELIKERTKKWNKFPEPLRSLVVAKETPGDSDLKVFIQAINQIRRDPKPELFEQLAGWIDEGDSTIELVTHAVMMLDFGDLEKWQAAQRKLALRYLIDALPKARSRDALNKLMVLLLRSQGGGELKFDVAGTEAHIEKEVKLAGEAALGACSVSSNSHGVTEMNVAKVAEECRRVLKERYADLR